MSNDSEIQGAFMRCVEAFNDRRYEDCSRQANAIATNPNSAIALGASGMTLLHLSLISLQRLGQTEMATALGRQIVQTLDAAPPWERTLLQLTIGELDPNEVCKQAPDTDQTCRAHFYAGALLETRGETDLSRTHYLASQLSRSVMMERDMAAIALLGVGSLLSMLFGGGRTATEEPNAETQQDSDERD